VPHSVHPLDRIVLGLLVALAVFSSNATADATLAPAPFRLAHLFERPGWLPGASEPAGVPAHLVDRLER
jgi:hypothetical protein